MDVSLRHWPIFATGLLLGAAGTMALGLQRPTQWELAAAAPTAAAKPVAAPASAPAVAAPAATVAQVGPDAGSAERADAQIRAATEAFRTQELLAAAATPSLVALVQPPKPRIRRVVKEADAEAIATRTATDQAIALRSTTAPPPSEPVARQRSATSVMGAAPARRSEPVEAMEGQVQAARGSAHAPADGEARSQSD
jgi:hypothetical protein